jgi:hypothetical protein
MRCELLVKLLLSPHFAIEIFSLLNREICLLFQLSLEIRLLFDTKPLTDPNDLRRSNAPARLA